MADFELQVKGLAELGSALQKLPQNIAGKTLGAAVKAGADLIQGQARANARALFKEPTGATENSIVAYHKKGTGPTDITYQIGVTMQKRYPRPGGNYPAYWWRYKEFGTVKMGATPFLRPAFDMRSAEALAVIKRMLAAAVEVAANQMAKYEG